MLSSMSSLFRKEGEDPELGDDIILSQTPSTPIDPPDDDDDVEPIAIVPEDENAAMIEPADENPPAPALPAPTAVADNTTAPYDENSAGEGDIDKSTSESSDLGHKEEKVTDSTTTIMEEHSVRGSDNENEKPAPLTSEEDNNNNNNNNNTETVAEEKEKDTTSTSPTIIGVSKMRTKNESEVTNVQRFSDLGEFGFYQGEMMDDTDTGNTKRHGLGKMTYDSGNTYEGPFVDDKFHGDNGTYRWFDGDEQEGSWMEGERHGKSIFRAANGVVEYSTYEKGKAVGEGVTWNADRTKAHKMIDGKKKSEISSAMAEELAKEKFDLPVPEPSKVSVQPAEVVPPPSSRELGFITRLFSSRRVGSDGTLFFKDYGEWGSYEGDVDAATGNRRGEGRMTYDSGAYYEGGFVDDKFQCESGTYRWADGEEYEGPWKEGERHGAVGIFRSADGSVDYSKYEKGSHVGDGVWWSADRKECHKTEAGDKKAEILMEEGEAFCRETFDLPIPETPAESSRPVSQPTLAPTPSKSIGFIGRLFSKRKVGVDGTLWFKDNGEWGSYDGSVDAAGNRVGNGKMTYESGNLYEGGFVNDVYESDKGTYHWIDDDEYEGAWKSGERHGTGIFRTADGSVEYSMYEKGVCVGDGVWWSADRKTAHKMEVGDKKNEISLGMAEELSKKKFDLPVPEPSKVSSESEQSKESPQPTAAPPTPDKPIGFLGRLFKKRKVGPNGELLFKDNGEWGSYNGDFDAQGKRHGQGKMTYDSGNYYEGAFANDKFHGDKGVYHWSDGDEYEGQWKDGERDGIGIFRTADGNVVYSKLEQGTNVGEGLSWSADRKTVHKTMNDTKKNEISAAMAEKLAKDMFDLPVPEPSKVSPVANKSIGLIQRIFSSKKVDKNGNALFKDYGEWGSYEGDLDADGKRQGKGKMIYGSTNYYEGGFVDDKFDCDKGLYHWADGDEYEGAWKDGERNGVGIFRTADGTVEYSIFENGASKGEGLWWSADRKTAHTLTDGVKKMEILIGEAESLAQEKFDLPIPKEALTVSPALKSAKPGLLRRLFQKEGVVGPDGKMRFKDYGDWGSYDGELDNAKKRRHGKGTMKYDSGNYYEGGFVDNKYHCVKGIYKWIDGDEYEGQWSDGERSGIGVFRQANGTVEYSMYELGSNVGEGVTWSADCKKAFKLIYGKQNKKNEISLSLAEKFAKDTFDLPVPEPSEIAPNSNDKQSEPKPSFFGRIFSSQESSSTPSVKKGPRFEDYGDEGTYDGELANGLRQGEGKMFYDSGNSYEGDFSNNKFDGNKGLYRWSDGTEYEGTWKDGAFDGIGIYRKPDVGTDYSMYEDGYATGVGIFWNTDYTKAYYTFDGVKQNEAPLDKAASLAKVKFGLPAPSSKPQQLGITASLGQFFQKKKVGPDGKPLFKDHGDWGSYKGDLDESGQRHGNGKMTYYSGNSYEGGFVGDKAHGDKGVYHWADGDEYEGSWNDGERHGMGIFRTADGSCEYSMYEKGSHVGEGVWWNADRQTSYTLVDGNKKAQILAQEAESIAKDKFGLPVPDPSEASPPSQPSSAPTPSKNIGFIGRLFSSRKVGSDGTRYFKDYGEWGSYEGDVDESGNRQGQGKMTYDSGSYYEGGFVKDKFHCDTGVYHWSDGDEYVGEWTDGERNGKGSFKTADGSVEYSLYEQGQAKGEGIKLSADHKTAHALTDGDTKMEMLIGEAESLVKEKFGFSI